MSDYEIVDTNADIIDGCSLCGCKNANNLGYRRKTDWLRKRYAEGLRYKVLRSPEFADECPSFRQPALPSRQREHPAV